MNQFRGLYAGRRSPGVQMATRALEQDLPRQQVEALMNAYSRRLLIELDIDP
ncbi:MAG: hypothetical protein ACR2LE_07170 [Nocardioidaceae bacterium]